MAQARPRAALGREQRAERVLVGGGRARRRRWPGRPPAPRRRRRHRRRARRRRPGRGRSRWPGGAPASASPSPRWSRPAGAARAPGGRATARSPSRRARRRPSCARPGCARGTPQRGAQDRLAARVAVPQDASGADRNAAQRGHPGRPGERAHVGTAGPEVVRRPGDGRDHRRALDATRAATWAPRRRPRSRRPDGRAATPRRAAARTPPRRCPGEAEVAGQRPGRRQRRARRQPPVADGLAQAVLHRGPAATGAGRGGEQEVEPRGGRRRRHGWDPTADRSNRSARDWTTRADRWRPSVVAMTTTTSSHVEPAGPAPTGPRLLLRRAFPAAYDAMLGLTEAVGSKGPLEPSLLELIKIRASQINGCAYCIDLHSHDARRAGETDVRMLLLDAWRETKAFTPARAGRPRPHRGRHAGDAGPRPRRRVGRGAGGAQRGGAGGRGVGGRRDQHLEPGEHRGPQPPAGA